MLRKRDDIAVQNQAQFYTMDIQQYFLRHIYTHTLSSVVLLLESHNKHESVANRDDDHISHKTGGNTSCQEVSHLQISLSGLGVFHHDGSYRLCQ